jgi:hypothetical protein
MTGDTIDSRLAEVRRAHLLILYAPFLSDRLSLRLTLDGTGSVTGRQAHLPFGEDFAESGAQQKQHFAAERHHNQSLEVRFARSPASRC